MITTRQMIEITDYMERELGCKPTELQVKELSGLFKEKCIYTFVRFRKHGDGVIYESGCECEEKLFKNTPYGYCRDCGGEIAI